MNDAIDLSIEDRYKNDHISIVDTSICEELIYQMVMDKFNLDSGLNPSSKSYLASAFKFDVLDIEKGDYEIEGDKPIQKTNPYVLIKGSVEIKPMIINFNENVTIDFEVYCENKRYDL